MTSHRSWIRSIACVLVFTVIMPFPTSQAATERPSPRIADRSQPTALPAVAAQLPLRFERAHGDTSDRWFVARGAGYLVGVTGSEARLVLRGSGSKPAAVAMRLVGSRPSSSAAARKPLPGVTSHLTGNDPSRWKLGVRGYAEVEYHDVYPGVSVVYYGNERQLEYDFVVAPRANPTKIALAFDGTNGVRIDGDGQLVIATDAGDLVQKTPVLYQDIHGDRHTVDGGYAIRDNGTVGFSVGKYDPNYPLVIDPVLSYSTYLGGSAQERANAVAVDAQGNIVVAGETYSADFPTVDAAQGAAGFGDVFVAKLTPSGDALVYAAYVGGHSIDSASGVVVDASGNAYIVGTTWSRDFPTFNAAQPIHRGESDSFVAKLDVSGALVYSTLLGGSLQDLGNAIAVDARGRAHVAGSTISSNFPTKSPLQADLSGNPAYRTVDGGQTWTGVRTGLNSIGVLSFAFDPAQPSTMYAGTQAEGVFRSEDGGVTWTRTSEDAPSSPVYTLAIAGGSPGTLYAATIGGVFRSQDRGQTWTLLPLSLPITSLVLTADGTIYAGTSSNFVSGVLKSVDGGDTWVETGVSGDVQALAVSGTTVYASTGQGVFRSSDGQEWAPVSNGLPFDVAVAAVDPVDPSVAYAAGFSGLFKTISGGAEWFPIPDLAGASVSAVAIAPSDPATIYVGLAWGELGVSNDAGASWRGVGSAGLVARILAIHPQVAATVFTGGQRTWDAFAAIVSADGASLEYSTYLGGTKVEQATGVAVDETGDTYVTGNTQSEDFPVLDPVQPTFGGIADVFVVKLSDSGVLKYATYLGGGGSEYHARIGVDAAGQAHVSGLTWSMFNFPVANAYQPTAGGGFSDAFVSVLNQAGDGFVYSTYFGGSEMENDSTQSLGPVLAVTPSGDTYIAGTTQSANFPTTADAFQTARAGVNDGFVARFDPLGGLQYSTFLGGSGEDNPRGIAVDGEGAVVVTGYTSSADWPTVSPLQPALAGPDDAFIARIVEATIPSDTVAPETSITIAGSEGLSGWYRSPVAVTLSAVDTPEGTGVSTIEYAVGAGAFQPYTAPFTIAAGGVTHLTARSTDAAGNVEDPAKSATVNIDAAPPTVTIASPEARDYLHSDALVLSVSASDPLSGVAPGSVSASLAGINRTIGEAIQLRHLSLGTHTARASASDLAGNSAQQTVTFRVVATIDSVSALVNTFADEGLIEDGARRTLQVKLAGAQEALERGNASAVREMLREIIGYCTDQRNKKIAAAAADTLVTDLQYVIGTV